MAEAIENKATETTETVQTTENKTTETAKTEGKTFSEDYVHALREESKSYRIAGKTYENALRQILGIGDGEKIDNLEERIKDFTAKNEKAIADAKAETDNYIIQTELNKMLGENYNNKLINKLLDTSGVTVESGQVKGLKEALEKCEKEYPEVKKTQPGKISNGTGTDTIGNKDTELSAFKKALGL